MDTLSHGLYGGITAGRKSRRDFAIAFFFGVMPDIAAFGPYMLLSILGVFSFSREAGGKPDPDLIPSFVYGIYSVTHSAVVYAIVVSLIYTLGKRHLAWLTIGWPLHIIVDIPTHTHEFFPTPFLWPLSRYTVDGISWGTPWIFFPNVALLIALYTAWWIRNFLNKTKNMV
jgi:hypothetical protein